MRKYHHVSILSDDNLHDFDLRHARSTLAMHQHPLDRTPPNAIVTVIDAEAMGEDCGS